MIVLTIFNQSSFLFFIFQYWNCKPPILLSPKKQSINIIENAFPVEMATRNKRKLAASNKENCEEHARSNLAQNSNAPRSQEDYITQVSEEIDERVTEKVSQEFSRMENCILGALARLDDFLMNPLIQGHSGTAPETFRNVFSINQGTNEDDSQSDPHPEAGLFNHQMTQNSGPEDGHGNLSSQLNIKQVSIFPIYIYINSWFANKIVKITKHLVINACDFNDADFVSSTELDNIQCIK